MGGSNLSFFGCDSALPVSATNEKVMLLDEDGSAYLFGDCDRVATTITGSFTAGTGGGVCSFCGNGSESFLYCDALRNLIFTLRNSFVSTSAVVSSSGFEIFDFLLRNRKKNHGQ